MKKGTHLYLLLAVLGLMIGSRLDGVLSPAPKLELDFGQGCERAALSPDGRFVAGLIRKNNAWYVGVANVEDGTGIEPVEVPDPPARVQTFAWHSGSRWVAFGCHDHVRVFDTTKLTSQTFPANPSVRQVLFRGDTLLGRADDNIYLWNIKSGKRTFHLRAPHLLHADLTADGKTLAVGCFREGVRLVAVPSKKVLRQLAGDLVAVSPTFCHKDQWLATGLRSGSPQDDQARLYDVASGRQLGPMMNQPRMRGMAVSPDGSRLLLRSDDLVTVWQPSTGQRVCQRALHSALVDALSRDGKWVASVTGRGEVTVWNPDRPDVAHELPHPGVPSQISFTNDDRLEVAGDRYRLWWIR